MALVARRYLCIMITSVAVESMFSKTGHILAPERTSLGYAHFRDLALLKTNESLVPALLCTTWETVIHLGITRSRQAAALSAGGWAGAGGGGAGWGKCRCGRCQCRCSGCKCRC